jgi:hypothetical protein
VVAILWRRRRPPPSPPFPGLGAMRPPAKQEGGAPDALGFRDLSWNADLIARYRVTADGGLERLTTVDVEDRLMDVVVR